MKQRKKFLLLPLVLLLSLVLASCAKKQTSVWQKVQTSKTVVWGVRNDTPLFGLLNIKSNKIEGFDIDIAKAVTKKMLGKHAKVKFVPTSPKTRIQMLKNGNIDAVAATMTITPERAKQISFSIPYFGSGQSLLVKKTTKLTNVKELNGQTVLVLKGTTGVANIERVAPKAKILQFDDQGQAFAALKAGQALALTDDNGILGGIANENPGFKLAGGNFTREPYGIGVNKGQKALLKHINRALRAIKADGTYHRLVLKWFKKINGFDLKAAETIH